MTELSQALAMFFVVCQTKLCLFNQMKQKSIGNSFELNSLKYMTS